MLIVSQDKETIINFDNVTEIAQEDGKIGITKDISNDAFQVIGIYITEERAKDVLQEIINTYRFNTCVAVGQKNAVYEMPEE